MCSRIQGNLFFCFFLQFDNPVYEASDGELYYQKNGEVEHQYTVFRESHENDTKVSLFKTSKLQFKIKNINAVRNPVNPTYALHLAKRTRE